LRDTIFPHIPFIMWPVFHVDFTLHLLFKNKLAFVIIFLINISNNWNEQ